MPAEEVAVARADRLAGVDAEAHAHLLVGMRLAVGPCALLDHHAGEHGRARALEAGHEPVALRLHDPATVPAHGVADDPVVLLSTASHA